MTDKGWFAAHPSGTENVYKVYAESFKNQEHLDLSRAMVPVQQRFLILRMINPNYIQNCLSLHPQSADVSIASAAILPWHAWQRALHLEEFLGCPIQDGELHLKGGTS